MQTAALALSAATVAAKYDADAKRFAPVTLNLLVTNVGMVVDQFNVDILDLPADWFTRSVPGMRLRPGVNSDCTIEFHPPRSPEAAAGSHRFRVRVTPQEQPNDPIEATATLEIDPFVDTTFELVEPRLSGESEATFRARVRNQGNLPLSYTLSAVPNDDEPMAIAFLADGRAGPAVAVTVPPAGEAVADLTVATPPINGVERPPAPYTFFLQAIPGAPVGFTVTPPPPPLRATGVFTLLEPPPIETRLDPPQIELIDLLVPEATVLLTVTNPSRRVVAVLVEARPVTPDFEMEQDRDRLVLLPAGEEQATQTVTLTVRRAKQAPLVGQPQRISCPVTVRQIEIPPELDPAAAPPRYAADGSLIPPPTRARLGSAKIAPPPPLDITIQPPGLKVTLDPPKRRGGSGKYKMTLVNQSSQQVRAYLTGQDPDNELEVYFGTRPGFFKRAWRRLFRYGVYSAESAVWQRVDPRATTLATEAGVGRATDATDQMGRDDDSSMRGRVSVTIEPRQTATVPLEVSPYRPRLVGQSTLYSFSVATDVNGSTIDSLTRQAQFEHRPVPILLVLLLIFLLLSPLFIIIPAYLGCMRGSLEFSPFCVPTGPLAAPPATLRQAGASDGKTTVFLREGSTLRPVAEEPSAELPGQFAKLVVPSPDKDRVLYVKAKDEVMTGTTMMIADRNGNKSVLKTVDKGFWPAQPVWCQRQSGDPGRIAYVTASEPAAGRAGLQLRVLTLAGTDVEEKMVLEGTTGAAGNGFTPQLFYGGKPTPLVWWDNCNAIKYGDPATGRRWLVDLRAAAPGASEIRTFNLPPATTGSGAGGLTASACETHPFAQTDPGWAQRPIGKPGGPILGAHGCTLAAAATVFKYYGVQTDPNQLMGCAAEDADFFKWNAVAQKCAGGRVTNTVWKENPTYQDINDAMRARQPAIVGMAGGPSGSHYVIVVGGSGESGGDFRIQDPWDGSSYKRLSDYLETGSYRVKWLVKYEGTPPTCAVAAGTDQPAVKFAGIADGGSSQQPVRVTYEVPSGATVTATSPSGTTFDKEGFQSVGVALPDGTFRALGFFYDKTAPKTTAAWKQDTDKLSGVLTLTAKDTVTPVALTRFRLEGQPERDYSGDGEQRGNTLTRGVPLEFKSIGEYRVQFFSVDAAGNRENPTEFVIKVVGKLPTPQLVPSQVDMGRTDVQKFVTLNAVDGVGELPWKAAPDPQSAGWLSVEPTEGVFKVGDQPQRLTIKINRDTAPFGEFAGQIAVSSKTGGTETVGTVEVKGIRPAPPTATPVPTPTTAQVTATAEVQARATNAAQSTAVGTATGRGACSTDQRPFVEPANLTIPLTRLIGELTFRDSQNKCIQWYAIQIPDWIALEAQDFTNSREGLVKDIQVERGEGDRRNRALWFTTQEGGSSIITVRPDWNKIRAGTMTEGQIILRDDDKARRVVITVKVTADRRSISLEVQNPT